MKGLCQLAEILSRNCKLSEHIKRPDLEINNSCRFHKGIKNTSRTPSNCEAWKQNAIPRLRGGHCPLNWICSVKNVFKVLIHLEHARPFYLSSKISGEVDYWSPYRLVMTGYLVRKLGSIPPKLLREQIEQLICHPCQGLLLVEVFDWWSQHSCLQNQNLGFKSNQGLGFGIPGVWLFITGSK